MFIPAVLQQHADDAAVLASNRSRVVTAPDRRLPYLLRYDRRLAANLDGLHHAGEIGWALCESALAAPSPGAIFTAAVRALETRDEPRLEHVLSLTEALGREAIAGLVDAFAWVEPVRLQNTVAGLLHTPDPFRCMVGVAACAVHRVAPREESRLWREAPAVRARVLRMAGELGRVELLPLCRASIPEEDPEIQLWGSWSAVLLGDRDRALSVLTDRVMQVGSEQSDGFRLALQAMSVSAAHATLQKLARVPADWRKVIAGSGISGDPAYVPWLIHRMADGKQARLAAEAFTLITGVDLGVEALDRPAPEARESGPTDDPDDPDVDMDPDDDLSWPDPERIQQWWVANAARFQSGTRYFIGRPVTHDHCVRVLVTGTQRQRMLAANYLCLIAPGTPLFNTAAPAWRQNRLLAQVA